MESDTIASHHAGFLPPVSLMGPAGTRDLWERREGAAWGVAGGHAVTVQASQKVSASMPDSVMVPHSRLPLSRLPTPFRLQKTLYISHLGGVCNPFIFTTILGR